MKQKVLLTALIVVALMGLMGCNEKKTAEVSSTNVITSGEPETVKPEPEENKPILDESSSITNEQALEKFGSNMVALGIMCEGYATIGNLEYFDEVKDVDECVYMMLSNLEATYYLDFDELVEELEAGTAVLNADEAVYEEIGQKVYQKLVEELQ